MKNVNLVYLALICFALTIKVKGQSTFQNIDSKWDNFYENDPSGIENNYSAIAFIKIIDFVGFKPQRGEFRDNIELFKKVLLRLDEASFNQMRMTGVYYCRTFKHDDYFELYNLYYSKISKDIWDKYCPYLLPLMDVDGVLDLK